MYVVAAWSISPRRRAGACVTAAIAICLIANSAVHAAIVKPTTTFVASPNFNSRGSTTIDSIVIHTTESSYTSTINTFLNTSSQVSAHFVIASDGGITQMVDTSKRAWHATYYNSRAVGIEMVGYAGQASTWNRNNLGALANLLAWLVDTYPAIPLVHPTGDAYDYTDSLYKKTGLVAHGQVQPWNRTDPGVYFPWADVINAVSQRLASVPEPTTWALGIGGGSVLVAVALQQRWARRSMT